VYRKLNYDDFVIIKINYVVSKKLTNWENPRTNSGFNDSFTLKIFMFEFVSSYGPLVYVGHFRSLHGTDENGYFGLGKEYLNKCDDTCLSLLSLYVYVFLIIEPLPRYLQSTLWP
jgi:hypothetical protein